MRSRRHIGVGLGALLAVLLVLYGLRRDTPERPPALPATQPEAARPTLSRPNAAVTPLRVSPAVIAEASGQPCVRGAIRSVATNAPVPNAELVFETSAGATVASTDAAGSFETLLPSGTLRLAGISASGFHTWAPTWGHSALQLTPLAGKCVNGLLFFLTPRAPMAGLVISPEHEPVAGATITIHARNRPDKAPLHSDAQGEFQFEAPEEAVLVATHPDYEPGRAEVGFVATVTHALTVMLGPRRAPDAGLERHDLHGRVLDAADAGVSGALVMVSPVASGDGGEASEADEQSLESDERGEFSFTVAEPGAWTVSAEAEGLVPASKVTHGEPVELRLLGGGTLTGTVSDSKGAPLASFAITLAHREGAFEVWPPRVLSFVDPAGRFTVHGVQPGTSVISAAAFGLAASEPVTVELAPGATGAVSLKLGRGGALSGRVVSRDGGVPLQGARISLEGSQGEGVVPLLAETRSGADGAFTLSGIPMGRHSIYVAAVAHNARLLPPRDFREAQTEGPELVALSPVAAGEEPQLELMGIGAALKAVGDALLITQAMPGGGAAEAGLTAGDAILSIDGVPVASLGFVGGIERIRGPENTLVELQVRRADGSQTHFSVPRRRITH